MSNLRKMPRYETEEAVFCLVFHTLVKDITITEGNPHSAL
jgi:hypothetical protein